MAAEGEYREKGDYHRTLDPEWRYRPVYLEKIRFVEKFLGERARGKKIIDLGCGEGILVEKFRKQGFDITGIDMNYRSRYVRKGDITRLKESNSSHDVVLCLDVVEHLPFEQQKQAFDEIRRILKPDGIALVTLPNLAHLASRVSMLLTGKLIRTSSIERHMGDRPIGEFLKLIKQSNLVIEKRKGIFPTLPFISLVTCLFPSKALPLHRIENRLFAYPNWCIFNILLLKRGEKP